VSPHFGPMWAFENSPNKSRSNRMKWIQCGIPGTCPGNQHYPFAHYHLSRLYNSSGTNDYDKTKAEKHYNTFKALWKNADNDLKKLFNLL